MRVIITRAITKLKQKIYKHDLKKQTAQYKCTDPKKLDKKY